jgi:hypothetical protein
MNGHQLADAGIERARLTAEAECSNWTDRIMAELRLWLVQRNPKEFAIEDFRAYVEIWEHELVPASTNAWGSVAQTAVRRGIIKNTGRRRPARSRATHAHQVPVYVRAV